MNMSKEHEAIKDRIVRDITKLFESGENYYKPIREDNFSSNNNME